LHVQFVLVRGVDEKIPLKEITGAAGTLIDRHGIMEAWDRAAVILEHWRRSNEPDAAQGVAVWERILAEITRRMDPPPEKPDSWR
jgi:hypothetical protein